MKIVFDARVHLNYYSGISRYIMGLLTAYASSFPEDELIVLINPTITPDNPLCAALKPFSSVSILTINAGHMGPRNYTKMGRIIRKLNPDVYHYPHLDAPIFAGKIPIVATVHDSNSNEKVKKFDDRFGLKAVYFKSALRLTLKHAKKVIFVSDSIRTEILQRYNLQPDPNKFLRLYNGFEGDFNSISETEASELRKMVACPEKYMLFVGQIRMHKNSERVIAAFKKLEEEQPQLQLLLVGHNYLNLDLNQGNIQHIDRVSEQVLKALYEGCISFVFPSLFEGFGFPILEAFAFGKPVVTTNYGATKEVAGDLGILVDPNDIHAIYEGMKLSLEPNNLADLRKKRSENFNWTDHVRQLREVYLAAQNRP